VSGDVGDHRSSDRTVALGNDPRGLVAAAVDALADLPGDLPDHALVGGLAVMVRLSESHRVTTDFDEVTAHRRNAIDVLVLAGAEVKGSGVWLPSEGLQLDLLEADQDLAELAVTIPTSEMEAEAVQFAMANRFALESSVPTDIVVVEREVVLATQTVRVATAGALVVMKVNAALSSSRARDKAASDVYDAYRLIRVWGFDTIAGDLTQAPGPMLETAGRQLERLYDDEADRTTHELRRASIPGVEALSADDLASVAGLGERLRRG
jgi:hypothetical protein